MSSQCHVALQLSYHQHRHVEIYSQLLHNECQFIAIVHELNSKNLEKLVFVE